MVKLYSMVILLPLSEPTSISWQRDTRHGQSLFRGMYNSFVRCRRPLAERGPATGHRPCQSARVGLSPKTFPGLFSACCSNLDGHAGHARARWMTQARTSLGAKDSTTPVRLGATAIGIPDLDESEEEGKMMLLARSQDTQQKANNRKPSQTIVLSK